MEIILSFVFLPRTTQGDAQLDWYRPIETPGHDQKNKDYYRPIRLFDAEEEKTALRSVDRSAFPR